MESNDNLIRSCESQSHVHQRREEWNNDVEFLFSCISLSVGLGNVWRFPFIALENGSAAFVIPYIIAVILIGRPIYYMEIIIGQFTNRGSNRAFDCVPVMRGVAYGQIYATYLAITYYAAVMAITLKYLTLSFTANLPWSSCLEEWGPTCISTNEICNYNDTSIKRVSSAELFYTHTILREKTSLDNGLGLPNWDLVACLFGVWCIVIIILIKGIRTAGRASYFLALFPYVVMLILLIRAITLPGAFNGIKFFLNPQWSQLVNPKVWYTAITQMFFSLSICFGTITSYSSFNKFNNNINKVVGIVTFIDSFTSILSGCIIFGILGNLAYETNTSDITKVLHAGAGLAFISYPEAIAKFPYFPQFFAVIFFLMLFVIGIGSNVGMVSSLSEVAKDHFRHLEPWVVVIIISMIGFLSGLVYTTPGGQWILNLVDFFGCSFIVIFLGIIQIITVSWIYGVRRLCADIKFMLHIETGIYWRLCWGIFAPGIMLFVLTYTLINYENTKYKGKAYPDSVYAVGWFLWLVGVSQFPCWALFTISQQPASSIVQKIKDAFNPLQSWGPFELETLENYHKICEEQTRRRELNKNSPKFWQNMYDTVMG